MSLGLFDAVAEVERRILDAPHLLLCLSLDGLLGAVASEQAPATVQASLTRQVQRFVNHPHASVALMSAHSRAELRELLEVPGLVYAGNHGLEISGDGFIFVDASAAAATGALAEVAQALTQKLRSIPSVLIEEKGLTTRVHYREIPTDAADEVRRQVHGVLANANQLYHLTTGEKFFEVRPRVDWNQSHAIAWIKERLGKPLALVIYVSDNAADEEVFAVLPDESVIKVGARSETAATYHLTESGDLWKMLKWLEKLVCAPQPDVTREAEEEAHRLLPATIAN